MPLLPPTTPQLINALRLGRPLRESAATFDDGAPEHALSLQQPPPPSPTVAWPRLLSASAEERARRPSRERGLSAPRVLDGPPPTDGGGAVVQTEPDETFLVRLKEVSGGGASSVKLGPLVETTVVIVNDDFHGTFTLPNEDIVVSEGCGEAKVRV